MATKTIKLQGTAAWAKVFPENRDKRGFEDAYVPFDGAYTIELTMDKANFEKLAETGAAKASKMKQKEVEKLGETILKFVRKHADRFEWSSGAPDVYRPDGEKWDFERDGVIPNGSKVTVEVDVYTTSKATGTRLVSVFVTEKADMEEGATPKVVPTTPTKPTMEDVGVLF